MNDGKSVEVGLAGWEGFVGMPLAVGFGSSASRAVIQAEGTAFRINADDIRQALPKCPQLMMSLMRYSQEAAMEVTQIAACNRLHSVETRLARWLLMSQDRIRKDILPLTQEFLSQMLGTRRASVSVAAAVLQRAGLIKYNRGHVFDPQSRCIGNRVLRVLSGDSKAIEKVAWRVGVVAIPYRACCAKVQTLFCLPPRIV